MLIEAKKIYSDLGEEELIEISLKKREGILSKNGALVINTGKYTGRSPDDKFIVDDEFSHDKIAWGPVNHPISREDFQAIKKKVLAYAKDQELYEFHGFAGAEKKYRLNFRILTQMACQNLFARNLLIIPAKEELEDYHEDYTLLSFPEYKCDPEIDHVHSEAAILLDYANKEILICGTAYSGEIKKSVFSAMNFHLPYEDVLPMHCSANMDPKTVETALFFGLSGTGKTTLSADPDRLLIGDDEHGFSNEGIFNFEGGCYAKCIDLSEEKEPDIYHAIKKGTVLENVVLKDDGEPDYSDSSLTENTRAAYPLQYISNSLQPSVGKVPSVILFLTADAFGVLPPISILSKEAAMYHFITGFTSKVAGTERGVKEPQPTFSTLFGEPFMPLATLTYADMLGDKLDKQDCDVYLVNTGWIGGSAADGASRIPLKYTRALVSAALEHRFDQVKTGHSDIFNLDFPLSCQGVPDEILDPKNNWKDKDAYDKQAKILARMLIDNFSKKYPDMPEHIVQAGPVLER